MDDIFRSVSVPSISAWPEALRRKLFPRNWTFRCQFTRWRICCVYRFDTVRKTFVLLLSGCFILDVCETRPVFKLSTTRKCNFFGILQVARFSEKPPSIKIIAFFAIVHEISCLQLGIARFYSSTHTFNCGYTKWHLVLQPVRSQFSWCNQKLLLCCSIVLFPVDCFVFTLCTLVPFDGRVQKLGHEAGY